ncbi:MAG: glycosyltransferase family 39 protein [Candidatus Diapherotrites archaeon]|nr:glycosyltransferase family 39 protein [Candidatus Diapherotrites archaeon]
MEFIQVIKKYKLDVILMLALFLFAFGIRIIPSETFPGIYAFDPFYHARVVRTLLLTGSIPDRDPLSYWPESVPYYSTYPHFYHYSLAGAYELASLVTQGNLNYNESLFVLATCYFTPFIGALTAAAMYLLGKEIRGRKAGLFAGLLLSLQPTHLFRTMYGFAEEDAFGIFWLVFSAFIYLWALRKGKWKHGLIAGFVFALYQLTWRMAVFSSAILSAYIFLQSLIAIYNKNYKELERMTVVYAFSFIPIVLLALPLDPVVTFTHMSLAFMFPTLLFMGLATYWFNYRTKEGNIIPRINITQQKAFQIFVGLLLIIAVIGIAWKGPWAYNTAQGLLSSIGQSSKVMKTVGEEHPKTFPGVINEMNILAPFFLLGLIYLPIRRLIEIKKLENKDLLIFLYAAITFFLYINKAKMGYVFGPPEMLLIGIVLADGINLAKKVGEKTTHFAFFIAFLILFAQIPMGVNIMEGYKVNYSVDPGWEAMYTYLKTLPYNPVLMTWWDYGHWTAWHNIRTTLDNTNQNQTKVIQTAKIFTEFRGNTSQEIEERWLDRVKSWQVTHVAIDRTLLTNKWGALTFLGDNQCIPTKELKAYGLSFPELQDRYCGYGYTYAGDIGIAPCYPKTIVSSVGTEKYVECRLFSSGPIRFTEEEWKRIVNTAWPGYDLTVGSDKGTITMKVYGQPDYKLMFFKVGNRIVRDAPVNYMLGLRLFFKDPNLKHYKLVRNQYVPNKEVVLYKVDYGE